MTKQITKQITKQAVPYVIMDSLFSIWDGKQPAEGAGHITESYFSIRCTVKDTGVFDDYNRLRGFWSHSLS